MNPPRQTNERSDIRMNLEREFPIGAWATFYTIGHSSRMNSKPTFMSV